VAVAIRGHGLEAHLPAGMTEGGGTVKPSQWDYKHSEIFRIFPRGSSVTEADAERKKKSDFNK